MPICTLKGSKNPKFKNYELEFHVDDTEIRKTVFEIFDNYGNIDVKFNQLYDTLKACDRQNKTNFCNTFARLFSFLLNREKEGRIQNVAREYLVDLFNDCLDDQTESQILRMRAKAQSSQALTKQPLQECAASTLVYQPRKPIRLSSSYDKLELAKLKIVKNQFKMYMTYSTEELEQCYIKAKETCCYTEADFVQGLLKSRKMRTNNA